MDDLDILYEQGNEYFSNNEFDKAIQAWENAVDIAKKDKEQQSYFLTAIADAYFMKNDYDKAIEYYKSGMKKTNDFNEKIYGSFKMGQAFFEKGDIKKALKEFTDVYILVGKDIFDEVEEKYFEFFSENVLLNPKKQTKLISNFMDIVNSHDFETFKRVFDVCKINATDDGYNAFFYPLDYERLKFLLDNGLDPNDDCGQGSPAIVYQSFSKENINLLKEYGADLDYAMDYAIAGSQVQCICNLMECGVDLDEYELEVEDMLDDCTNVDIIYACRLAKIKVAEGLEITDKMKKAVKEIGKNFEAYRQSFDRDSVQEYSDALNELYEMFDVEPVPQKSFIVEKITVKSKTWQKQHAELWDMLVPGSGFAPTIQGELIRIIGRVEYEILDNGGINWDDEYKKMLKAIPTYISKGNEYKNDEIKDITTKINVRVDEEKLFLLNQLIVEWVLKNPNPIKLDEVDYNR